MKQKLAGFYSQVPRLRPVRVMSMALIGVLFMSSAALGHAVYQGWAVVWQNSGSCLKDKATIDHPNGSSPPLTILAETSAKKDSTVGGVTVHCADQWLQPTGHLRIRWTLFKNTSTGVAVCKELGYWFSNAATDYNLSSSGSFSSLTPCGHGDYYLHTRGQVQFNGNWVPSSGGISSGSHNF